MERPDTLDTPVEPQIGEDQYIDTDGNVRTDDTPENLEETLLGEKPFWEN